MPVKGRKLPAAVPTLVFCVFFFSCMRRSWKSNHGRSKKFGSGPCGKLLTRGSGVSTHRCFALRAMDLLRCNHGRDSMVFLPLSDRNVAFTTLTHTFFDYVEALLFLVREHHGSVLFSLINVFFFFFFFCTSIRLCRFCPVQRPKEVNPLRLQIMLLLLLLLFRWG